MSIIAPVKPYFKYSMDLKDAVPVVAYYCKLYAVNRGLDLLRAAPGDTKEVKTFLISELQDLEVMKAKLGATTKDDHRYQIENFVLSVFAKIDKDERTCETVSKVNALDFKRCSDFINLLSLFGPMEAEWTEREKYCKYKAATILKCLKNGEVPPRGNPFAPEVEEE
jgi:vacuolar protein sorting-associated protein VTA1